VVSAWAPITKSGGPQLHAETHTIGIVRANVKIGMQNLAYNMRRLVVLEGSALAA
jgi:hypothetical protein